jgi:heat shock protein HslJ
MVFTRIDGPDITAATPIPQAAGTGWRYAPLGADLAVTLRPGRCRDTMTGMPHPATAQVETGGQILTGCAGAPRDLLAGPAWTVFEIAGQAVAAGMTVTIEFDVSGSRVYGTSGCNRYAGGFSLTGESLSFAGPLASSMMACEDPQMAVERHFLDALKGVDRFDLTDEGHLVLLRADRPVIRARR